jgi:hypothetical protein
VSAPASPPPAAPRTGLVLAAAVASTILPGAGQLLLGRVARGLALLLPFAAGGAAAAFHLLVGLEPFETRLGTFLFAVLLRALGILVAFSAVDAYLLGVDPEGRSAPSAVRLAVLGNLLVPGTGYLVARSWLRALTGLALLGLVFFFAHSTDHPYLDPIFMAAQAIMGFSVYRLMKLAGAEGGEAAEVPPIRRVQGAELVLLGALLVAIVDAGIVLERRLPLGALSGLAVADIEVRPAPSGVRFEVRRLGLSMTAVGPGWTAETGRPGFLFSGRSPSDAIQNLTVGVQPIPAFVRGERYPARVRRWIEEQGFTLRGTSPARVGGLDGVRMDFSGHFGGDRVDQRAFVVPRGRLAFLFLLTCTAAHCDEVGPLLDKSLATIALAAVD